jgi:hypothetical protein
MPVVAKNRRCPLAAIRRAVAIRHHAEGFSRAEFGRKMANIVDGMTNATLRCGAEQRRWAEELLAEQLVLQRLIAIRNWGCTSFSYVSPTCSTTPRTRWA